MIQIQKPSKRLKRFGVGLLLLGFLIGSFTVYLNREDNADAADATKFNPGNIVSDYVFYNYGTMSANDIQSFLNSKMPTTCNDGYTCLKDYSAATVAKAADNYCSGYSASSSQSSAQMIYGVAQSCKVNPQVLLVLLQKETGLVTHKGPGAWRYQTATGYACPDSGSCDSQYYGLFNQLYHAARQYKVYQARASSYNYMAGRNNSILWSPNSSCGSSTVYIENQATAGLYNYTPYRPNQAALNAGYGTGDGCSAYGNRNFWLYFTDWFGDTQTTPTYSLKSKATDTLRAEAWLRPGEFITSSKGSYILVMQYSGQLILYKSGVSVWQSSSVNWSYKDASFVLQGDGNMVIYKDNSAIWSSGTDGNSNTRLVLQDTGNLVLYSSSGSTLWSSGVQSTASSLSHVGSELDSGTVLNRGEYLRSLDWRYFLVMQGDGNLVLYTAGMMHALWSSGTDVTGGKFAIMQGDGNFVVYGDRGALWSSGTDHKTKSRLVMQNDGNIVVYSNRSYPVWSSGTDVTGGKFAIMQGDGNFVVYGDRGALWSSGTNIRAGDFVIMQNDGNLVIYNTSDKVAWASHTGTSPKILASSCDSPDRLERGSRLNRGDRICSSNKTNSLVMQGDGNLVMYKNRTNADWSSDTSNRFFKSNLKL